jgi:hypothetical protein
MLACKQTAMTEEDGTDDDANIGVEMRLSYTVSSNLCISHLVYYNKTQVNGIMKHHLENSVHISSNFSLILAVTHVYVYRKF